MKIRFLSFDFSVGHVLSHAEFIKHMLTCHDGDFEFAGKKRCFYLTDPKGSDYYLGLLITIKDQKKYPLLKADTIKISDVAAGHEPIELNYFVISKKSYRVMYQQYHQSCSVGQFTLFLNQQHKDLANAWIEKEMIKGAHLPTAKRKTKRVLARDYGRLSSSISIRTQDLPTLLEDLERVSTFEFDAHTLVPSNKGKAKPLNDCVRKEVVKISYKRESDTPLRKRHLLQLVKQEKIKTGKIRGLDSDDIPRVIDLVENAAYHAEHEFDQLITKLNDGVVSDLEGNPIIEELIKISNQVELHMKVEG